MTARESKPIIRRMEKDPQVRRGLPGGVRSMSAEEFLRRVSGEEDKDYRRFGMDQNSQGIAERQPNGERHTNFRKPHLRDSE